MEETFIQKKLKELFPQKKVVGIEKIKTGLSSSRIYLITLDSSRKFIFKVYPLDYKERIREEIKILKITHKYGLPVPKKIAGNVDELFLIEEYLEGETLFEIMKKNCLSKDILFSVGENLAKIHLIPEKEAWQNKNKIKNKEEWISSIDTRNKKNLDYLKSKKFLTENQLDYLVPFFEDFKDKVKDADPFLCPIHGDYNPQNIIILDKKVRGILDFELHRIAHNLNDLGIVLYWYNFYDVADSFQEILKSYNKHIPLEPNHQEIVRGYYLMQVVGALSFLIKSIPKDHAITKLKKMLEDFIKNT